MPQTNGFRIAVALLRDIQRLPIVRKTLYMVTHDDWEAVDRLFESQSSTMVVPAGLMEGIGLREYSQRPVSLQRPTWWMPWIGTHALQRYQEHYRWADRNDVLWDLVGGVEVHPEVAASMMGRHHPSLNDYYILGRERRGLFVLSREISHIRQTGFTTAMATYIRLAQESVDFALKEWPVSI